MVLLHSHQPIARYGHFDTLAACVYTRLAFDWPLVLRIASAQIASGLSTTVVSMYNPGAHASEEQTQRAEKMWCEHGRKQSCASAYAPPATS